METPNTPPKDDSAKQTGEDLPDSELEPPVDPEIEPVITLNEETGPEELGEPRSNVFQTSDDDSLSEPGTQDQDKKNTNNEVQVIEPEKQKKPGILISSLPAHHPITT